MRKILFNIILMTVMLLSACQPVGEIVDPDDPDTVVSLVKSDLAREINPDAGVDQIETLAQSNSTFALQFYNQIRDEDGNIIFSPFSLSLALSMALAGAESTTERAMLDALQLNLPQEAVHPAFNALLLVIEESQEKTGDEMAGDQFQLNIANSIWGQSGFNFKQNFLDILAQHYEAGIFTVDFIQNPEGARNAINNWVAEETEDKIENLLPAGAIDTLTRLVLANAIYFNGSWMHPFDQNATSEAPFFTLDGAELSVNMMRLYGERFQYRRGENFQVLNLPYMSRDFAMTLLVPNDGTYVAFEENLAQMDLSEIFADLTFERVDLEMPKFDFESSVNANQPLIALGMGDAFDPTSANFSGITDEEALLITDVLHKATITVDEEGTEAAAATAVVIGATSAPIDEPISLVIDRPFMFMIRHLPTNTILFMGRVLEP